MENRYREDIRARVLATLREEPVVSIGEVAKKAKTMRVTARKHLEALVSNGEAIELRKGSARLFMLRQEGKRGDQHA